MEFNLDAYKMYAAFELAKLIPFYQAEGIFQFGSTVYKNKKPDDIDIIVVYNSDITNSDYQFKSGIYNVNAYHLTKFTSMLHAHKIDALECLFLPSTSYSFISPILQSIFNSFVINKSTLRRSIASTCSNSYAKAKKKLLVKEDYDLEASVKSLWHSFRIMNFGIQIAETNKINDFKAMNQLFVVVIQKYISTNGNWDEIHSEFKPLMNELHTKFKLLCPLEE